tara:strand:+ start:578 stop:811 length:234 start_codon:yes stop_codon:yes gene_type:complete
VPRIPKTFSNFCKQARALLSGARDVQNCEGSDQPILVKGRMLDVPFVTGQRLEGAVGVVEPSIICGHRVGNHAVDPD